MNRNSYYFLFKFIVIGDTGVGKSCLVLQFVENRIRLNHDITIGVEFGAKVLTLENRNIKLQIWDTAGQENFRSITRSYYRSAIGALLVYDISRRETFEHLHSWIEEMRSNGNQYMNVMLVGNKSDRQDQRQVTYEEGLKFAQDNNLKFIETSAKDCINVEEAFNQIAYNIYNKILKEEIPIEEKFGIKPGEEYKQSVLQQTEQIVIRPINVDPQKKCC